MYGFNARSNLQRQTQELLFLPQDFSVTRWILSSINQWSRSLWVIWKRVLKLAICFGHQGNEFFLLKNKVQYFNSSAIICGVKHLRYWIEKSRECWSAKRYDYSPTPKQEEKQKKLYLSSEGFCMQIVMNRENMVTQNTFSEPCTEKTTPLCIEQTGRRAKHWSMRLSENRILKFVYSIVGK